MKTIIKIFAAALFAVSLCLTDGNGQPGIINLSIFSLFAVVARYADSKGYLDGDGANNA